MLISVKDIIKQSIELYRKNYLFFLKYMLLLFIPTGVMSIAGAILGSVLETTLLYGFGLTLALYLLVVAIGTIASLWISIAFIRTIVKTYNGGKSKDMREELLSTTHLIIPAIAASILTTLILLGGLILLIIPGIIFSIWFAFVIYRIALEEDKAIESLHHSKELVKGRWWAVLWRLVAPAVVFAIVMGIIQGIIGYPLDLLLKATVGTNLFILTLSFISLITTAIALLITPLTTTAPTILYLDLKKKPVNSSNPVPSASVPKEPPKK